MSDQDSNYQNRAIPATGILTITIPNWEKYNYRSNLKARHSWFRFENLFFLDPEIYELTLPCKALYIYILCECSRHGGQSFKFNLAKAASDLNISRPEVAKLLKPLVIDYGMVDIGVQCAPESTSSAHESALQDIQDKTRQDSDAHRDAHADPLEVLVQKFSKIHADEGWVRLELRKCRSWYAEKNKKFTERAFGNWLRKGLENKPIATGPQTRPVEKYWDAERNEWLPVPEQL